MLRFSCKSVGILKNILKCNGRIIVDTKNCRTVIKIPYVQTSFFSDDVKNKGNTTVKSPLGTLIQKEAIKEKAKETSEEEEAKRAREASWRTMKYTLIVFGISFVCIGGFLIFTLGKPEKDERGRPIPDDYSSLPLWKQYIYRTLSELDYYKKLLKEPSRPKLLPDVMRYPYYQPPYTLVLELTDVLVHPEWTYQTGWRFKKRPAIDYFLETLNGLYEIVIYTAEQGMTVFPIVEALDPKNIIAYKLVRDATHFVNGTHVKALDNLNRDLSKVIVIDWNAATVKFHPDNLFQIPRWNGDSDDTSLVDLATFLKIIAQSEISDVREVLRHYSEFDDPIKAFREKHKQMLMQQDAERQAKLQEVEPPVKRWSPSFLYKRT